MNSEDNSRRASDERKSYFFHGRFAVSVDGRDHHIFGVSEPIFFDDVRSQQDFSRDQIPFCDELIDLKFHDVRLDHALRCFCHAMRDDALTSLFCYIAIEVLARRVDYR